MTKKAQNKPVEVLDRLPFYCPGMPDYIIAVRCFLCREPVNVGTWHKGKARCGECKHYNHIDRKAAKRTLEMIDREDVRRIEATPLEVGQIWESRQGTIGRFVRRIVRFETDTKQGYPVTSVIYNMRCGEWSRLEFAATVSNFTSTLVICRARLLKGDEHDQTRITD